MASYAQLETALARLHGADADVQRTTFRARMKHLQRLGLPLGEKPGKGRRIDYSQEQIWQLTLALELSQCGIDPAVTADLIANNWRLMVGGMRHAQRLIDGGSREGWFFVAPVAFMSTAWDDRAVDLNSQTSFMGAGDLTAHTFEEEWRRAVIVNVTDVLRRLKVFLPMDAE